MGMSVSFGVEGLGCCCRLKARCRGILVLRLDRLRVLRLGLGRE